MSDLVNELILSGQISKCYPLQDTISGLKVARFILKHTSSQLESGVRLEVKCQMYCIWVNPKQLEKIKNGALVTVVGFLSNNVKAELVLHITKFLDKGN